MIVNEKNLQRKPLNNGKKKRRLKYKYRCVEQIFFTGLFFVLFLVLTIVFLIKSFHYYDPEVIQYKESSALDYKVYLKENNFYEEEYLGKDMIYVASLIDHIVVDYEYIFDIDKISSIHFNYDVIAKLSITNENEDKIYFEKEYVLLDNKQYEMIDDNRYHLLEEVKINYDYYNSLANNFKQSYGVNSASNLIVYLKINKQNMNDDFQMNDENIMIITIPLSERSIDIQMDYNEMDVSRYVVREKDIILDNVLYVAIASSCMILSLIFLIKFIRVLSLLIGKKSKYDKFVRKILKEYDRLIVENFTGPDLEHHNVIQINRFEELLDARDNFKLPIMYYNVLSHQKCYFYVKHDDDIYLMIIQSIDLEENKTS